MSDEFDLIGRYFSRPLQHPETLGVGDDCALLPSLTYGTRLAVSTDTLLQNTHFPADAEPGNIASRALRVCVSDLAAMGARPLAFTLALTLPKVDHAWLAGFSDGLYAAAAGHGLELVGGDTTRGSLAMTLTVFGEVAAASALRRDAAMPGDTVYVSGTLGDGAAALHLLQQGLLSQHEYFSARYFHPDIDSELGQQLCGSAHAAIDVSDGLLADLGHILTASAVGARLFAAQLPLSPALQDLATGQQQALDWAIRGGDDYRLCFTMPAARHAQLQLSRSVYPIGAITEDRVLLLLDKDGLAIDLPARAGFQHFE